MTGNSTSSSLFIQAILLVFTALVFSCSKNPWLSDPEFGRVRLKDQNWSILPAGAQADLGSGTLVGFDSDVVVLFMEIEVLPTEHNFSHLADGFVVVSKDGAQIEKATIMMDDNGIRDLLKNMAAGKPTPVFVSALLNPDVVRQSQPLVVRHVRVDKWEFKVTPLGSLSGLKRLDLNKPAPQ